MIDAKKTAKRRTPDEQWIRDIRSMLWLIDEELEWAEKYPELSGRVASECIHRMHRVCQTYFKYREEEKQRLLAGAKAKTARKRPKA